MSILPFFPPDFHKIGGFSLLPVLLRHPEPSIKAATAELMGTLAQNNPYCQAALLGSKALDVLIPIVDNSEEDDLVRIKALFAISCGLRMF
jgi:hsp70-interacting protein